MNLQEMLQNWLIAQYNEGKTDEELANMAGCTRVHINRLRHGKFPMGKVKLETLLKLFPNIRISLDGSPITATNSAVNAGVNNGNMTIHAAGDGERLKSSLRSAILKTDDICDKCKVKILTLLETI